MILNNSNVKCIKIILKVVASRIDDYDYDLNHVMWHYIDHDTKNRVDVYDRILPFIEKLIIHIPDENFKMIRYIGGYATKKKKLGKLVKKNGF